MAQPVGLVSRYVRHGAATVARGVGTALHYLVGAVAIVLYLTWVGFLRYLRPGIATFLGYVWAGVIVVARAAGQALRQVGQVLATVLRYVWANIAIVASAAGQALRYLVVSIATYLGYAWTSIVIVARAAGQALRQVGQVLGVGLGYAWTSIVIVARAAGQALRQVGQGLGVGLGYVWAGVIVVARAAGQALRQVGQVLGVGLGYVWTSIAVVASAAGQALRYLVVSIATFLDFVWPGVIVVARAAGQALGLVRQGLGVGVGYVWAGVIVAARAAGQALGLVRQVSSVGLGYVWTSIAIAARAAGQALRQVGQVLANLLRYVWANIAIVARAAGQALRYLVVSIATFLGFAWAGVIVVVRAAGQALGLVRQVLGVGLGYAWTSMVIVARAAEIALRYVWIAALNTLVFFWLGITVALKPIWTMVLVIFRFLGIGVSTAGFVLGWTLDHMWRGLWIASRGLVGSPYLMLQTVRTAYTAARELGRPGVWMAKHRKGVSDMSDNSLNREGLVSLVVTVLVLFTVAAIGVRMFWPAPPEPTVVVAHWTTGHLTRDGLLIEMADEFNKAGYRTRSGEKIVVEVYDAPSQLQGEYLIELLNNGVRIDLNKITNGYVVKGIPDPTIVTPSSAHWLVRVNYKVGRTVVDPDAAKSIVRPVIGIVTYEEMARCLGWPQKQIGFADIIALKNDPRGWGRYPDCAKGEWGVKPLLAFTDPKTSSTGRSLHLALYSIAANKRPADLTIDDVNNPNVEAYVKGFQRLIDHYLIGTTVLNTKIYQGTRYGHFFIMPEDNLIHLYEGTERPYLNGIRATAPPIKERMVMIYPKEGSMPRKNCACIVQAEWVSEEQVEASQQWIEYIREDEQQRTFMAAGFRPGTDLDLNYPGSKISSRFGLNPDEPKVVLNPSEIPPEVAAAIDSNWEQVKKPGIVTFVVDTSGSMMGAKLSQAIDGLSRAFNAMAQNNQVGLLSFDDTIHIRIPVGLLKTNQYNLQDAIHEMRARGETALYEAIKAGIEMTAAAPGEEDATRVVVVLTDGLANICNTRLDDIIEMGSRNEAPILSFSGCQDAPPAQDTKGRRVNTNDIFGTGLAIEARNPVQVFFIGIGDADLNIGRLLSEATGAEYQGVTEKDLANVLEKFSGYF